MNFCYIDPYWFMISFFVGMFFVYISTPKPDIIIKYPTLENAGKIIYQDDAGECYKYMVKNVQCPADKSKISKNILQHGTQNDKPMGALQSMYNKLFPQSE